MNAFVDVRAPAGGKIAIREVIVDESIPWQDAVAKAGPQPNINPDGEYWDVDLVGDQYPEFKTKND